MSVFLSQKNYAVGDIAANANKILADASAAAACGATVAATPELALCGYPAEDMHHCPSFQRAVDENLRKIIANAPPRLALLVGLPVVEAGVLYNACALVRGGKIEGMRKKTDLPNFSVFDEKRHFAEAQNEPPLCFEADGKTYAAIICQEMWDNAPAAKQTRAAGAQNAVVINGSPFYAGKQEERHASARAFAKSANCNVHYINLVGGQDELVFDGGSFVVSAAGELLAQMPAFAEAAGVPAQISPYPAEDDAVYMALQLGLQDYARKSGFANGAMLGLSGGVDSALVATLAADALGGGNVLAAMLPSPHTSQMSRQDAQTLAKNLGASHCELPIDAAVARAREATMPQRQARAGDVTDENLQARMRGLLLMTLSNNRNLLLLATGNKSEMAMGYCTLYGDTNGGYAPIKDALKTQVWRLCRLRNERAGGELIPRRIIERAPSAELRPNQTDQDTLPPYPLLDAMLQDHLQRTSAKEMAKKYDAAALEDFYRRLLASEHKRRQAPPGAKVSRCAFGRDWRMPVANRFAYA